MKQRVLRVADAIKDEVGQMLLFELKDPRIAFTSVSDVEVSGDLRLATIYFSVLGTEEEKAQTLAGLESSKGLIRSRLAKRLNIRNVPEITLALDDSIARGARVLELLKQEVPEQSDDGS